MAFVQWVDSPSGEVTIQSTVEYDSKTYTVTYFGESGTFKSKTAITSITIPSTITEIPTYCFYGCTSLATVVFEQDWNASPYGVTTINDNAFDGCTALTTITLPQSLTTLGKEVFRESGIETIEFKSVPTIGASLFWKTTQNTVEILANAGQYSALNTALGVNWQASHTLKVNSLPLYAIYDNTGNIETATCKQVNVENSFHADYWNTFVIPFAMTADEITTVFGTGTKVVELSGYADETVSFTSVSTITANKPCMIRPVNEVTNFTLSTEREVTASDDPSDSYFKGTYNGSSNTMPADTYYIKQDKVYKSKNTKLYAMHGYFDFSGASQAPARSLSIVIDGETTGIESIYGAADPIEYTSYNLAGQRLAHPQKGINIVNGKKVIIK